MKVLYIGNLDPPHSTETHVAQALRALGHDLFTMQENHVDNWRNLSVGHGLADVDLILWTRTGWDWPSLGVGYQEIDAMQRAMLARAREFGIPTVGYHLDRWWGLARQHEIATEAFFGVSLLITADGGHDAEWAAAGVNHLWMPPAVSEFECEPGTYRPEMASDVAFVGSWQGGYHSESMRAGLIAWLRTRDCRLWPEAGHEAVRGEPLRDLYASVKILVGDSCVVPGDTRYWSDRIPESLGRSQGAVLIHPDVPGLEEHFESGAHLVTYPLGDYARLGELIDYYLDPDHEDERKAIAICGRTHVLVNHTYTTRMRQLEGVLNARGMLCPI